jgi:hypothetical protein
VLVRAEVVAAGRRDKLLEQVVSRRGLDPVLSAIGWTIAGRNPAEDDT